MTLPDVQLVGIGPDDDLFPAWCEVLAAGQRADRPDEPPRPASDHVALGRRFRWHSRSARIRGARWSCGCTAVTGSGRW